MGATTTDQHEADARARAESSDPIGDMADAKAHPWVARFETAPPSFFQEEPPPRQWLLRDTRAQDAGGRPEGVFPLGKCGVIGAEGGLGKSTLVTQLVLSVATGKPWLGAFDTPNPGNVLLILGEEDRQEVWRRLRRTARMMGIAEAPSARIEIAPLAGVVAPMMDRDGKELPFLPWLREFIARTGPYALVVCEPLSRFAPPEAEKDNGVATRFVTGFESLVPAGAGCIMGAHHTSQEARKPGTPPSVAMFRGVTGIVDGFRWALGFVVDRLPGSDPDAIITGAVVKTNYSRYPAPVMLRYGEGGSIIPISDEDRARADQARQANDPAAQRRWRKQQAEAVERARHDDVVVNIAREQPGILKRDLLRLTKARVHCADKKAETIIERVIDQGRLRRETRGTSEQHYAVEKKTTEHTNGAGEPAFVAKIKEETA
jgi:hypothetical protein